MQLESIWAEYHASLKSFLHSKVANAHDAEDLLQEVLIKTHTNLKTITDSSKIKPWLFQIANNTIIDFYRRNGRHNDLVAEDLWYQEEDEEQVIDDLSLCLLPFIKQLPKADSELLIAIEIEEIAQKDYAEKNGINYSTLKSRVKQSRGKLHNLFNRCCDFSLDSQGNIMDYNQKSKGCNNC
ncbi:RNA polymerase sigma factor SigZ [Vibrio makurazakiensis]|uniref:RNA polymerase sigma factor SigZ n=1 Tax=Vibrio makurazakiensis TaxID=2910250 RepID=UPI003D0E7A31